MYIRTVGQASASVGSLQISETPSLTVSTRPRLGSATRRWISDTRLVVAAKPLSIGTDALTLASTRVRGVTSKMEVADSPAARRGTSVTMYCLGWVGSRTALGLWLWMKSLTATA